MKNDMKKDYFWNTLGIFAQNAISPLLLVAITRINGIYDSGIFSFAFSVAIIFWTFGMWGGRTYQVSDVKNRFSHRSYIMVRLVLSVFMLIGAILFSVVNHYDTTKSAIIVALVLFKVIESISDAVYGILQVNGRLYKVGKSLLYKAILGFGAFIIIDTITGSILLSSLAIVVANILIVLAYDLRVARKLENIHIPFSQVSAYTKKAFSIMKECAPVFAVAFLVVFSLNIPRYFIDMYHSEQVGYFGILAMPITLIALFMSFVLQPNVVGLSKLYNDGEYKKFNNIVKKLTLVTLGIGLVVLIGAYLIGVPALNLVFGVDFGDYKVALMVMIIGGIVNAFVSIFINILIVMRHFKAQFYILLCTNIALVILSYIIIRSHGLLSGIALFTGINVVQAVLLAVAYRYTLRKQQTLRRTAA
jgi:O-antigen/teichoic acid export membrane protein